MLSIYGLLGGKLPSIGDEASDFSWLAGFAVSYGLPAFGAAGAAIQARVAGKPILQWAASVAAAAAAFLLAFLLCFYLTQMQASFTVAIIAGIFGGFYAAPPYQRQIARYVLAGVFAAISILAFANAVFTGSNHAMGYATATLYAAVGYIIAVQSLRERPAGGGPNGGARPNDG